MLRVWPPSGGLKISFGIVGLPVFCPTFEQEPEAEHDLLSHVSVVSHRRARALSARGRQLAHEPRAYRRAVPPVPRRPALARGRGVPPVRLALDRRDPGAPPLLLPRLPLPLQRHLRHGLPQLAPADLEVVPRDRAD